MQVELDIVKIEHIEIGDRFRKDFGDVSDLAASIAKDGLIQPIAVKKKDDGTFILLAGERRLRALLHNKIEKVPVRIYGNHLNDMEMRVIELAENFYRKDFEWREATLLQKEIHDLQQRLHGKKISTLPDAPGWSMSDTASLVGRDRVSVLQDIQIADAVEKFPELFVGAKNKSEAMKRINKAKEDIVKEQLAKKVASSSNTLSSKKTSLIDGFITGSFFDLVKKVPTATINLVELDPPYAIDLQKIKAGESANLGEYNEVLASEYEKFIKDTLVECYRVMTNHSWLIFWHGHTWTSQVLKWIREAGFETGDIPAIWTKNSGQTLSPQTTLASSYEPFFYARKGSPAVVKAGRINNFSFAPVAAQLKTHPTEKPIELMEEIYKTFVWEGSRILIPFLGSGNGIISASKASCKAFGYELTPRHRNEFISKIDKMEL